MLEGRNLHFAYRTGRETGKDVLRGISFAIHPGDFIGLIGSSGSGKTTFLKHLNGLLRATEGELYFLGENVYGRNYPLSQLRRQVGLVFQYPEQQLFCRSVLADVMYGPCHLGMTAAEAEISARAALEQMGIGEEYYARHPVELSGGQKRCVAIAGILAMEPRALVLDEPAAGLDPLMKRRMLAKIQEIHEERGIAVLIVSHDMEDVACYAEQVWLMHEGRLALQGSPQAVFAQTERLHELGADVPQVTRIGRQLREQGFPLEQLPVTLSEAASLLCDVLEPARAVQEAGRRT